MRNTVAICLKELRLYFTTPIAYVVLTGFTFVTSFFFLRFLDGFHRSVTVYTQMRPQMLQYLNFTDQVLGRVIFVGAFIMMIAVPFITMRLLAEERRSKTFELLMTCPVRPIQIALGKYLATLVVLAVMVAIVILFPILVATYAQVGAVAWETVFTGLLGMFLIGAGFAAIGLFISALTSSQAVAAFVTWCVLMLLWAVGLASGEASGALRSVLSALSATEHLASFVKGAIDLKDLVYFLSLVVFGLFMTHRALEAQRWR